MLNFLGIGAQKAGTSWLFHWLRHHPQISFPGGKELRFWNHLETSDHRGYQALFSGWGAPLKGEITPAYALLPEQTIAQVRAFSPNVRLIYLVRNPLDRAWSHARMALNRAEMSFSEASDQWFIDHFRSAGSLQRGDYEACIRNWRAVGGSDWLLIRRYEEIASDPRGLLAACCRHIGAPVSWVEELPETELHRRVFEGELSGNLRPHLREALLDLYFARIRSLSDYLGEDLSSWVA